MVAIDAYVGVALAGYGLLIAVCLWCLAARTHRGASLRWFTLLAVALGALRIADDVVYYDLTPAPDAAYIAVTFVLYSPPTIFLAQFALVCRAWAIA